ncbi:type II secretion system F family protein [Halobacillus karajensis]|uniref:Type IV pilin biogenesis protein n=1 Tax=Halobacillus karajensis TaxID=195088 RepID=A0A024P7K5_9BACI|nr:type II secretion system F family protein [Halobacillus karajensis]CDQ17983.1 type IV pilin biogenesis protein [Halobacillus karajensis]CDQ24332.1 type IV pilin biogenesis protein [Halobacillus karajensis]CDQ29419.1 type IV pilin biogenesis protein [Halobacillus karajensis]
MHSASSPAAKWTRFRDTPLSVKHQILFFKRCSHILDKGYPLLEALKMTGWDPQLKPISEILLQSLRSGDPIHLACQKARFSLSVTNFLYFSQVHHDLSKSFRQCKDLLQMKKDYKDRFLRVLRYPLFLFVFLVIACIVLQRTVMPNFIILFEGQNNQSFTLMVNMMHAVNAMGAATIFLFLSGGLLIIILPRISLQKKLPLYEKVPLLKFYQSFSASFLFTTHLYSLLTAGLTIKESLELIRDHKQYKLISYYSERILTDLSSGKTFAQSIYSCPLFRPELTNVFHYTNDIHALKDELEVLAEFFMDYINQKITGWLQIIQPAFFILIAVMIICIYASIMLPLYQWMNQI